MQFLNFLSFLNMTLKTGVTSRNVCNDVSLTRSNLISEKIKFKVHDINYSAGDSKQS